MQIDLMRRRLLLAATVARVARAGQWETLPSMGDNRACACAPLPLALSRSERPTLRGGASVRDRHPRSVTCTRSRTVLDIITQFSEHYHYYHHHIDYRPS